MKILTFIHFCQNEITSEYRKCLIIIYARKSGGNLFGMVTLVMFRLTN